MPGKDGLWGRMMIKKLERIQCRPSAEARSHLRSSSQSDHWGQWAREEFFAGPHLVRHDQTVAF